MKEKESSKIAYVLLGIYGFLFLILVRSIETLTLTGNLVWSRKYLGSTLLLGILGAVVGMLVVRLYLFWDKKDKSYISAPQLSERQRSLISFLSGMACLIGWLPYFIAFYPGICAYDSYIQIGQIVSGNYTDHHPLAHTLLLKCCMALGELVGADVNVGLSLFTVLQMIMLASVCGYGVSLGFSKLRKGIRILWALGMTAYLALFPFHGFMAVSITKDVMFTIFFLWQLLSLWQLVERNDKEAAFFLSTVLMVLMRNNGRYALLVLLAFEVVCLFVAVLKRDGNYKKLYRKLLGLGIAGLVTGVMIGTLLFRYVGATQGDRREMLSLPIQQFARVMVYHGAQDETLSSSDRSLDAESEEFINALLMDRSYRDYRGDIADPVKRHTNTSVALQQAPKFVTTYVKLFFRYPAEYVNAFLAVNAGFLDPFEESHAAVNLSDSLQGLGYVQTRWEESDLRSYGVYKDSHYPDFEEKMEQWASTNAYLDYPFVKYLVMPGIYFWLTLLSLCLGIVRKDRSEILPAVLLLGYYLTMFLGPTVQLRYVYPVMLAWPLGLWIRRRR